MDNVHRTNSGADTDATVPLGFMLEFQQETLRWPPELDHGAIVHRLVAIRESGPLYRGGLADVAQLLDGVERMPASQIASRVTSALAWTARHPGHGFLAEQLQIVDLNLKNLSRNRP